MGTSDTETKRRCVKISSILPGSRDFADRAFVRERETTEGKPLVFPKRPGENALMC